MITLLISELVPQNKSLDHYHYMGLVWCFLKPSGALCIPVEFVYSGCRMRRESCRASQWHLKSLTTLNAHDVSMSRIKFVSRFTPSADRETLTDQSFVVFCRVGIKVVLKAENCYFLRFERDTWLCISLTYTVPMSCSCAAVMYTVTWFSTLRKIWSEQSIIIYV